MYRLRRAGWSATLAAPAPQCEVVVGSGPASADASLPWDGPGIAALLGGERADHETESRLSACQAAVALSGSADLRSALEARVPRVLARPPSPPADAGGHASSWAVEAAAPLLGSDSPPASVPDLAPGAPARAEARPVLAALPDGFLALHPGSGSTQKNWPAARFGEIARRLSPDRPWLLVGGPADDEALDVLAGAGSAVPARRLPLRTLAAVLGRAGLYVGNDSGISHLAAATGAPSLALFGPTPAEVWRPLGRRTAVVEAPGGRLEELSVDAVTDAARKLTSV